MEKFYFFVPFSGNDELWIQFLSPLIFICLIIGLAAAALFVFTRTREPNSQVQNRYWWLVYAFALVGTIISVWVLKNKIEAHAELPDGDSFAFELGGVLPALFGSFVYVLVFYYLFTNILRRTPGNPKKYFPTFVFPQPKKLNHR
ncbi:hypothetical protein V9K67_19085 [Paraflavisolibacter sp. H34]|uniref:hypothetical protein n=1 Tax=Huijunlia imazamoxiresistens TaxID=3127457 RepID=UPI0030186694